MLSRHPRWLPSVTKIFGRAIQKVATDLRTVWVSHCTLLRENPGYAAALGAAAAAMVTQLSWGDALALLLSAAVAIWASIRENRPPSRGAGPRVVLEPTGLWS